MSFFVRYHTPVRRAPRIAKKEAPDVPDDDALQSAITSINDLVGPD